MAQAAGVTEKTRGIGEIRTKILNGDRELIEIDNFDIKSCGNVETLLNILPETIQLRSNEEAMGIIADADENLAERWKDLKKILKKAGYENIPRTTNAKGIILKDENYELPRIGIWLMPDNQLIGIWLMPDNQLNGRRLYQIFSAFG